MEEEKEIYEVVKKKIEKIIDDVENIMRDKLGIQQVNITQNPAHRIIFLGLLTHYVNLMLAESL